MVQINFFNQQNRLVEASCGFFKCRSNLSPSQRRGPLSDAIAVPFCCLKIRRSTSCQKHRSLGSLGIQTSEFFFRTSGYFGSVDRFAGKFLPKSGAVVIKCPAGSKCVRGPRPASKTSRITLQPCKPRLRTVIMPCCRFRQRSIVDEDPRRGKRIVRLANCQHMFHVCLTRELRWKAHRE